MPTKPAWTDNATFPPFYCIEEPSTPSYYIQPYGCSLCTKLPLPESEVDPKYVVQVYPANYSTFASYHMEAMFLDELVNKHVIPGAVVQKRGNTPIPDDVLDHAPVEMQKLWVYFPEL
ncbi:hypothetical protein HDV00_008984 [Rhizophlyctis rosea]|nr:hypothetical protein HDV00_008984 [Rhizophlyctis rosea]